MTSGPPQLSVVIPSYNSAPWLPSTLAALGEAIRVAAVPVEVLVVDDGSQDDTPGVVDALVQGFPARLELVQQENRGRFLARWEGIQRATADWIVLLDSRVLIDSGAVAHLMSVLATAGAPTALNGHVRTPPRTPLVGLFWDVPTHIFWGSYLRDPRPYELNAVTFDSAPKGTTLFAASRLKLQGAFRHAWPEGDAKLVSDDTKVLRWIAKYGGIRIDPAFSAVYRPRTTVQGFVRHTLDRGTLFVDSYAGTSTVRSAAILLLVLAPALLVAALVWLVLSGAWVAALMILVGTIALGLAPLVPAAINRCPPRSLLAYACILPVFVIPFWLGLIRGAIVHRRAFGGNREAARPGSREESG